MKFFGIVNGKVMSQWVTAVVRRMLIDQYPMIDILKEVKKFHANAARRDYVGVTWSEEVNEWMDKFPPLKSVLHTRTQSRDWLENRCLDTWNVKFIPHALKYKNPFLEAKIRQRCMCKDIFFCVVLLAFGFDNNKNK